jgi:hypothetical protein
MKNIFRLAGAATIFTCTFMAQASAQNAPCSLWSKKISWNACMTASSSSFETQPNTPQRTIKCERRKQCGWIS